MKTILPFVVLLGSATPAFAQGSDSCTTPTPISGSGPFPFDNSSATEDPQYTNVCGIGIEQDIWFVWTAPTTDTYLASTCGGTGGDTVMAVYDGTSCPTAGALGCNDDACAFQSTVSFSAVQGNSYVVQLGSFPMTGGGAGTFTIDLPVSCSPSNGPDVIVGEVNGVQNYPCLGRIDAISLGTTACNIGTTAVQYLNTSNYHPAIGGNLYRYHVVDGSGRFEQIGLSWLSQSLGALNQSLLCTSCTGTDPMHLAVGCSDPRAPSLNGMQGGLGPRWQVDAHTGIFTYPPANPAWSGWVARRCEFLSADVDTSANARYFGECQLVCPDDAAAGNQDNNASWRELSITGGGPWNFYFGVVGATQREEPAIQAWQLAEPGVTLLPTPVPGDGLFHVAYKTTSLGGGMYHYEIAIHNLDSDRDGASFSIPIPDAVTVENVGFHDVDYRDGDGYGDANVSGTDWTPTRSSGSLTWACEQQGPNDNALRWGTTYNFRFDANVAPVLGTATLALWKPGSPTSVPVAMDVPGGSPPPWTPTCFGDGTDRACPCSNSGSPAHGCQNSASTGGAQLTAWGNPSLSVDTLQLTATDELPSALTIVLQGDTQVGPLLFGDGLRCTGGNLKRLYVRNASAGTVVAPQAGEPSISSRSAALGDLIQQGTSRWYQTYYRDPSASFCPDPPGGTFNASSAIAALWGP